MSAPRIDRLHPPAVSRARASGVAALRLRARSRSSASTALFAAASRVRCSSAACSARASASWRCAMRRGRRFGNVTPPPARSRQRSPSKSARPAPSFQSRGKSTRRHDSPARVLGAQREVALGRKRHAVREPFEYLLGLAADDLADRAEIPLAPAEHQTANSPELEADRQSPRRCRCPTRPPRRRSDLPA